MVSKKNRSSSSSNKKVINYLTVKEGRLKTEVEEVPSKEGVQGKKRRSTNHKQWRPEQSPTVTRVPGTTRQIHLSVDPASVPTTRTPIRVDALRRPTESFGPTEERRRVVKPLFLDGT